MSDTQSLYAPGTVVQLRSGGPMLTVTDVVAESSYYNVHVIYFNTTTGMFEKFDTPEACLREANAQPQSPGARPRSSMSQ